MSGYFALIVSVFYVEVTICLKTGLPPWISSEFYSEYYISIPSRQSLQIKCTATNGDLRYQWYKNNIKIQTNSRIDFRESNGGINFHNLSKGDFGTYHCQAINEYGVSVSLYFKVKEASIGDFSVEGHETKKCKQNDYCYLTCNDRPHCQPKRDCWIEWKKGEGNNRSSVKTSKTILKDQNGTLHLLSVNISDGGTQYTCGIWNERIKELKLSRTVTTIEVNESSQVTSPQFVYENDSKVVYGETATLQCVFPGKLIPNITWYNKDGSVIKPNTKYSIKEYNRQLKILNVTFDDEGEFKCVSETNLTMLTLYLNVTSPPIFPDVGRRFLMKYVQYSNSEEIVLRCNATSAPGELDPVVINWMNPSYNFLEENRALYIPQNDVKEGGCYTCVAENSEGLAVANFLFITSKDQNRQIVLTVVIPAIAALLFLVVGGITLKRILSNNVETKSEQIQREERNNRHISIGEHEYANPDAEVSNRLYHMPDGEDFSNYSVVSHLNYYSVVSLANDYNIVKPTDDTSVFSSASNNVRPPHEYSILRKSFPFSTDTSESNTYDRTEIVLGIYDTSYKPVSTDSTLSSECDYI